MEKKLSSDSMGGKPKLSWRPGAWGTIRPDRLPRVAYHPGASGSGTEREVFTCVSDVAVLIS